VAPPLGSLLRAAKSAARSILKLDDKLFDLRYGIQTGGYVTQSDLDTNFPDSLSHAVAYQSTRLWTLRRVFRGLDKLKPSHSPEVFVDLGCGTGRACFYAATRGSFRDIVGVDFSPSLIERARSNARSFRGPPVRFDCCDAGAYQLPDRSCMVFMFNPFDEIILQRFLALNGRALRSNDGLLVYANDIHRQVLIDCQFTLLYRNVTRKTSIWQAG
jgi:SAM-dependent methyltransferase